MIPWTRFSIPLPALFMKHSHLPLSPAPFMQNTPTLVATTPQRHEGDQQWRGWSCVGQWRRTGKRNVAWGRCRSSMPMAMRDRMNARAYACRCLCAGTCVHVGVYTHSCRDQRSAWGVNCSSLHLFFLRWGSNYIALGQIGLRLGDLPASLSQVLEWMGNTTTPGGTSFFDTGSLTECREVDSAGFASQWGLEMLSLSHSVGITGFFWGGDGELWGYNPHAMLMWLALSWLSYIPIFHVYECLYVCLYIGVYVRYPRKSE